MFFSKLLPIFDFIYHFVCLNVFFVLGTLSGGGILGLFPSFYTTIVMSEKLMEGHDTHLLKSFIEIYRENFWTSLKYGYLFTFLVMVAISNVIFWRQLAIAPVLIIIWFVISLFISLSSLLLFSIVIDNRLNCKEIARLFVYSLSQLHLYFLLVIGLGIIWLAALIFPGIFIFLIGSLSLSWVMFCSHLFVRKVQKAQEKIKEERK